MQNILQFKDMNEMYLRISITKIWQNCRFWDTLIPEVRYCHYQLVSESENSIHPAIHNVVSLSLNSRVSIEPEKNT